jgi:hypothetical protein
MKLFLRPVSLLLILSGTLKMYSQNVGINATGASANTSAMLDITSGSSGTLGLLIPRMTQAQRTGIATLPAAAQGLVVYQTDGVQGFYYNTSTTTTPAWSYLNASSAGWSTTGNAGTTAGTNFIGTTDAVDWVIKTNATERMRVSSGGNVGIGITAPTQKLDVQGGNARINNTFLGDVGHGTNWGGFSHSSMASTSGYALLESYDGAYTLINKQNTGSGWIGFRVANSDVAVITNSGNMGIATTSPSVLLSVGGSGTNVYATSAWVENNLHVQGNENLVSGARGRLRVGTAWNYIGLYSEAASTGASNESRSLGWLRTKSQTGQFIFNG